MSTHVSALPGTPEPPSTSPFIARVPPGFPTQPLQPILPGMSLWVMNKPLEPNSPNNPMWRFTGIKGNVWEFECPCGQPGCTRTMRMTPKYHGQHPRKQG